MGGSWSSLFGSSNMQTREILDTIFKNLIGRADMRDLYSLADPASCKEYIVMTEAALKKLFKRFRLTRAPNGELLIQSIKGFQSASNPERGEQDRRCKELAFYFIRIFQIYAAITLSIIDSKMPTSDPQPLIRTDRRLLTKEHAFIPTGEEGIQGFAQPAPRWPSFSWSGGGMIDASSPYYITTPPYTVLNSYIPEGIEGIQPGTFFLPRSFSGALQFSFDSLYTRSQDPTGPTSFVKQKIDGLNIKYLKNDGRKLEATVVLESGADASTLQMTFSSVTLQHPETPSKSVKLTPLTVGVAGNGFTPQLFTQQSIYKIENYSSFPLRFESFLSSVLDVELPPAFSIGQFLMKYHITNDITGTEQDVGFINTYTSSSVITALKVSPDAKVNKVTIDFKTYIRVEKAQRSIHIQTEMLVEQKKGNNFTIKLRMSNPPPTVLPAELSQFVNPAQYADGYKQKEFSGVNGRLVSSDGLSLQAYIERSFKKIIITDETYQTQGGIEYRDGLPVPKDSERIPQSMKIKELWEALAQRPYVKAYAIALGSSLINPAGLKGDIKSAYSDICRSNFPYATDGSLPKPGSSVTTSYGLKALSALFLEGVEKGTPHIAESQKYKEFRRAFKSYFEYRSDVKDEEIPRSIDEVRKTLIGPCRGYENNRIKLNDSGIVGKLRSHVKELVNLQENHVHNSMTMLFKLFDQASITRGEFRTSIFVQNEGMNAVNTIAAETREMLMNYYMECERINKAALRDLHIYLGRTQQDVREKNEKEKIFQPAV